MGWWTACGSTIRTAWPIRPGIWSACARAGPSGCGWRRSLTRTSDLRDWPVSGTVGYEFLNDVCALFVDPAGEELLTALWESVSGDPRAFGEVALGGQASAGFRDVRGRGGAAGSGAGRKAGSGRGRSRGHGEANFGDLDAMRCMNRHRADGLAGAVSSLPVYRTYVEPRRGRVEEADRSAAGRPRGPVRSWLSLDEPCPPGFVTRFQQTTPAIMAKGVEDTAFYRYGRLLALNDVGGDPSPVRDRRRAISRRVPGANRPLPGATS